MPKDSRDKLNAKGRTEIFMFDPKDLVIVTDPKSPLFDERHALPVSEGLVLNMMFAPDGTPQGVLKPILVSRNSETGTVEVVDGRQRVKAAAEANKRLAKQGVEPIRVPAMLRRAPDHRLMGMLISSNEHGQADTPLGRAKKAQRYLDMGRDESEIAALFGITKGTVKNLLSLLDAPAAVKNALESAKITASDAYKLARLEPAEAKVKVAELLEHAPRTPGKKRSVNASKARTIVRGARANGGAGASNGANGTHGAHVSANASSVSTNGAHAAPLPAAGAGAGAFLDEPSGAVTRKIEDSAAADIAAWLCRRWVGAVPEGLIKDLTAGRWREA